MTILEDPVVLLHGKPNHQRFLGSCKSSQKADNVLIHGWPGGQIVLTAQATEDQRPQTGLAEEICQLSAEIAVAKTAGFRSTWNRPPDSQTFTSRVKGVHFAFIMGEEASTVDLTKS